WYAIDDVEVVDNGGTAELSVIDGAEALGEATETTVTTIGGTVVTKAETDMDIDGVTVDADDIYVDGDGNIVAATIDGGSNWYAPTDLEDDGNGDLQVVTGSPTAVTVASETQVSFAGEGISVANRASADAAIEVINNAINQVSTQRSALGAIQNLLEHTINNLGASSENLSAAEARIRDTDMAKEMMEFTKNNILTQAAQAMLAQAN